DVIAMHQAGITAVVATSGTALTGEHARQLRRMASSIVLTYDADAAGREAMLRALGTLLAAGLDVRVAELPAGTDPDLLVRQGGATAWHAVRGNAIDSVEYVQR